MQHTKLILMLIPTDIMYIHIISQQRPCYLQNSARHILFSSYREKVQPGWEPGWDSWPERIKLGICRLHEA